MSAQTHSEWQEKRIEHLERASGALIAKLDEIFAHPQYLGVFGMAQTHGFKYEGPNCEKELRELRESLGGQK